MRASRRWLSPTVSFGRLAVRVHIYRHGYPNGPDRWVVQPSLIWDRKR